MNITKDKVENCQAFLTIEVEPAELEESLNGAFKRLGKKATVPGFRKGKAPRDLLERNIGKERLLEDAINEMVPKLYDQAVKEQELDAIAQPEIEIAQVDPVIIKAVVPLRPRVTIGDYQSIQAVPEPEEITEQNIDDVINQLQKQYATWEPADRPVELNDLLVMDVESTAEDKPFINQKEAQYQVVGEQPFPVPGFALQLVGLKKNEEKEFKLEVPPDYQQEDLQGKEATFKVTVSEIKREILPEPNDAFATQVNPEMDKIATLREQIRTDMKVRADDRTRMAFEEKVIDAVIEVSEVEYPPIMIESEINRTINQSFQNNVQGFEDYLKNANKTEEEVREEMKPSAVKMVTRSLVLGKLAEDVKIEITEDDIDIEIDKMTGEAQPDKKEELKTVFNTPQVRESLERQLLTRKTMQLLTDIAQSNKAPRKKTTRRKKKEE